MNKKRYQQIYIEITNRCNLNCPFCSDSKIDSCDMSLDFFKSIIEQIKDYTHSVYLHIKGEPLIHPNFLELIKILDEYQIFTKITTNGTNILKYKDLLLNTKIIKRINISLQAITSLNDTLKSKYFEDLTLFLKDVKNTYVYLRMWTKRDSKQIIEYINKEFNGCDIYDQSKLTDHIILSLQDEFEWPSINSLVREPSKCLGGVNQLGIKADGRVVLCCLDTNGDTTIGNLNTTSFKDIIEGEEYQNSTNNMPYFELCKRCSYRLRFKKGGGA